MRFWQGSGEVGRSFGFPGTATAPKLGCGRSELVTIAPNLEAGSRDAGSLKPMEHPPAAPAKLLEAWMEWERGEALPGRVMSNLKTAGLRDVLEELVALADAPVADEAVPDAAAADEWTPVV